MTTGMGIGLTFACALRPLAVVEAHGPITHATELETFDNGLELLDSTLAGSALLKCMEPNLDVALLGDSRGRATAHLD